MCFVARFEYYQQLLNAFSLYHVFFSNRKPVVGQNLDLAAFLPLEPHVSAESRNRMLLNAFNAKYQPSNCYVYNKICYHHYHHTTFHVQHCYAVYICEAKHSMCIRLKHTRRPTNHVQPEPACVVTPKVKAMDALARQLVTWCILCSYRPFQE